MIKLMKIVRRLLFTKNLEKNLGQNYV